MPAVLSGVLVRVRMTVAYDGSGFHGMAIQGGARTVGGELTRALSRIVRVPVRLTVAGRTDSGVHARGQVVNFDLPEAVADDVDIPDLGRRLTRWLGPEIVVLDSTIADPGFDARHSAVERRYRYTVLNRAAPDPFLARTSWWVAQPLDLRAMRLACDPLLGQHDFGSFCRKPDQNGSSLVRDVRAARWLDLGDGLLRFDVAANAFCQQMVRSLVGTLVDVGLAKKRAGDIRTILASKNRSQAGPVAPPQGLCLWEVLY